MICFRKIDFCNIGCYLNNNYVCGIHYWPPSFNDSSGGDHIDYLDDIVSKEVDRLNTLNSLRFVTTPKGIDIMSGESVVGSLNCFWNNITKDEKGRIQALPNQSILTGIANILNGN